MRRGERGVKATRTRMPSFRSTVRLSPAPKVPAPRGHPLAAPYPFEVGIPDRVPERRHDAPHPFEGGDETLRRANCYEPPPVHERDPVAKGLDLIHLVAREEDGDAGAGELPD